MIGIKLKPPVNQSHVLSTNQVSFLYIKLKTFSYLSCITCDFHYRIKIQAFRNTFILSRKKKKKKIFKQITERSLSGLRSQVE